jgi:L-alanine-DL-glutamate epimerase-like enolase superfamily enzyme
VTGVSGASGVDAVGGGVGARAADAVDLGTITELTMRPIVAALRRPWGADVPSITVIEVVVTTSTGLRGYGFSWTPSIGAAAVTALLDNDIRRFIVGAPADADDLWPRLWKHLHEAGSGGITTIAMAGVDLALWDLRGRATGRSVTDLLGQRHPNVKVYGSGVNLHYSIDELVAQAQRWVARGYDAVKVKVGKPDIAEDVDRIAAVRETIGPDRRLMIDANQRWDLSKATSAIEALGASDLAWIEEPLLADDLPAHAELRRRIDVPIAIGENLHTWYRFRDAIESGACDIVQPNVVRVGGITPFLTIAELAAQRGVALHPHLLSEVSGQLAVTLEGDALVEDVEDASFDALGLLAEPSPVVIEGNRMRPAGRAGLGIRFA